MPVKLYAVIDMNVLVSALFARDPKSNTNAYLIWCWMEQYILIFFLQAHLLSLTEPRIGGSSSVILLMKSYL